MSTLLPPLHTSRTLEARDSERNIVCRQVGYPELDERLLKAAFHRFVRLLLGGTQDEVQFLTLFNGKPIHDDVITDFALDLSDDKIQIDKKFIARISHEEETLTLELDADAGLVPTAALESLAELLCAEIDGKEHSNVSILNHPPRARPVAFAQEPDIEQYPALLHGCFERRVIEFPRRMAIDFLSADHSRQQYTYREVDAISRLISGAISRNAYTRNRPVAVVMGPSPELYISYLAVLRSGHPFCPIPIDAPVERQHVMLEDLDCAAILTRELDANLPLFDTVSADFPIINTSPYLTMAEQPDDTALISPTNEPQDEDLAYIMYTSGSTGKPKGCQISHLSATCSIAAHSAIAPLSSNPDSPPTRWFQFAAPTFDPSIMEIFVTLSGGGTLCCAERQLTLDNINAVLAEMQVDVMMATPSLASLLEPQNMKSLWTMGEALSDRVISNFAEHNPDSRSNWNQSAGPRGIYNAYGPTEAAINCTLLPHVPRGNRGGVLGAPLPSCALIIVDEQDPLLLRPVPWGCAGELLIAGPQVSSRGYLNRPEETARAFLSDTPWGRAYRTGDRARVAWNTKTNEPSVEFLGRISSDQVKLSGRRVELGEIDAAIMQVSAVQEALTVVYKANGNEGRGSEQPITAVTLVDEEGEWEAVKDEIGVATAKSLPPFMRPYRLFLFSEMPRSAAGKLDRKALSLMVHGRMKAEQVARSENETSTRELEALPIHLAEVEPRLLDILADIVGSRPAPNADLVSAVGLDSLRAMQFLSRTRAQHLMESINMQDLLRGTSLRQLLLQEGRPDTDSSQVVDSLLRDFSDRHASTACQLADLDVKDVEKVLPSTATQSGMVASFMRSSHGRHKTYINHSCYHLNSAGIHVDRLVSAIQSTLLRREAYRTTFVPVDDSMAPFAQLVLFEEAATYRDTWCRVVRRTGSETQEYWLQKAELEICLERNSLYHIQLINEKILIISLFHGVFDGASLELLLVDIEREYRGLPLEPRSDISLAARMHFSLLSNETDEFWLKETKGYQAESTPVLSGNKPHRHSTLSTEPDTGVLHHTTSFTYAELQAQSRNINASPLGVWQTAWAILLNSFHESQTGDVMFGSVVSNRYQAESAVCHGPTFSMLPCRIRIDQGTSVGVLAVQTTRNSARILSHPHPALGLITTEDGKLPFDSLLALQHFELQNRSEDDKRGLLWSHIDWPAMRNDFGVMLEIWPSDPHIPRRLWKSSNMMSVKMTFKTSLFNERTAARILEQLSGLVTAILNQPERTPAEVLGSLPMDLLAAENVNPRKLDSGPILLHEQFENVARRNPGRIALSFTHSLAEPAVELTYGELDEKADHFARRLHRHYDGIAPIDAIIPICMEKSVELYIAVLGVLKSGAAWCPIDTAFPAQRKLELVKRTGSDLIVTSVASRHFCDGSLPEASTMLLVDDIAQGTNSLEALAPVQLMPDHLAYLIWTSGTTGAPKGVMIEHSAAVHAMRGLQETIPTCVDQTTGEVCPPRVLNFCAYSFDVFVQDLFYTWGLGGTLISSIREIILGNFVTLALERQATHAHLTPSFSASVRRKDLDDTLQVVTMIGEKLTENVAEDWSWNTKSYNTYGPAENAVVSTLRQFGSEVDDEAKAANVGWPLPSVSSFVVCAEPPHRLVPFNGVGELALGGHQLARGYLNDSAKTKSRFIWSEDLQQRIYLTGDVVRMVDHGIEFLGRNDDLVKLNGIRVELSEISATLAGADEERIEYVETLLLGHPERPVQAVVSFASIRREDGVDRPLMALDKRAETLKSSILARAYELLPEYMIPSSLVLLNQMPRTASNKVDRKVLQGVYEGLELDRFDTALHTSMISKSGLQRGRVRTTVEETVIAMLATLANVEAATISDEMSLARLGIHSISAIRLAWRLRKEAGIEISIVDLLTCSTIGQLLDKILCGAGHGNPEQDKTSLWLDGIERKLFDKFGGMVQANSSSAVIATALRPATAMQEALVIETLRNERSYWSHRMFRLPREVDLERLRAAWESVVKDNEILRTSFLVTAGIDSSAMAWLKDTGFQSPVLQAVTAPAEIRWSEIEWASSAQSLAAIAHDLSRLAREGASPIASAKLVCPWSISVITDSITLDKVMMMHIHHALHDAVSLDAIFEDVAKHYQPGSIEVPGRTQFGEAMRLGLYPTEEQREQAQKNATKLFGEVVQHFGPVASTTFPDMTASRQSQPHEILRTTSRISLSHSVATWTRLQAAMKSYNFGSPTQIFSAAFGSIVAEYLESKYIVLGETVSLRIHGAKLQTVVGPLIATVPNAVRIDISANEIFTSMASTATMGLHHVHPTTLRTILGIPSDQPLYPALMVFHPRQDDNADCKASFQPWNEMEDLVGLSVEHPLALNIFEEQDGNGLLLELSGDNQTISKQQLDLLLNQVLSQLDAMLEHPDIPLDELNNYLPKSLLSIASGTGTSMLVLEDLIREPSWTDIAPPTVNPVAWVEYHALHHPHWIAAEEIIDVDEPQLTRRWTYLQLLVAAGKVLRGLYKRAIPKGSVVAIHLDRTLESFAAIIALFRGGYIYLPLDEELPPERTRMLAFDSGARALVTTRDLWNELHSEDDSIISSDGLELILLEDVFSSTSTTTNFVLPQFTSTKHSADDGYILFTSGSTGKPKGVRVTNFNLCNFIECFSRRILDNSPKTASLAGTGKYLNLASRAFDPHLTHMFVAWRLGLAATIGPRMMMLGNLESVIVQNSITHFGTVPSVLQQAKLSPVRVPSVVFVSTGGEKVSNDVLDMWTDGDEERPLMMNAYGPTECTIGCSGNVVTKHSNVRNVGRIFDSATAFVFARNDSTEGGKQVIAKLGQAGELCIAGDLVSLGYMSRPEAQAKAFTTTEIMSAKDGSQQTTKVYKTGDLVRMMADGYIEYLGRSDQQAKVNGQRLELGEVEHFLRRTAEKLHIRLEFAAAVVDHPELPRPRLFAFVASNQNGANSGRDAPLSTVTGSPEITIKLSGACSESLPAFMVPDLIWINRIPLMQASGKVDSKRLNALLEALPLSKLHNDNLDSGLHQRNTELLSHDEELVVKAIEDILGSAIQSPAASRSIFELGVDSLSAVHLSARLKQLGFDVTAANVLSHATIGNIAKRRSTMSSGSDSAHMIQRATHRVDHFDRVNRNELVGGCRSGSNVEQVLPAMLLQSALLARSMAQVEDAEADFAQGVPYVTHFRYSLSESTVMERFTSALETVLQEEEMLRTCFRQTRTGEMAQIILSQSPSKDLIVLVNESWISWRASNSPDTIARDLVEKLGSVPPIRVHVFEVDSKEVLLSLHHSLFDGDAIHQLRVRIQQVYGNNAKSKRTANAMRELAIQFAGVDLDVSEAFWQKNLANVQPCLIDDIETSIPSEAKAMIRAARRLSLPLTQLRAAAQANNTSLNALFQTAFAVLLSEILPARSEVVFGSVLSLRPLLSSSIAEIDSLVAPCLNTLPQRVQLSIAGQKDGTLRGLTETIQQNLTATVQHAYVPLDRIFKWACLDQALFDAVISVNMHKSHNADDSALPGSMKLLDTLSVANVPFAADINIHDQTPDNGYVEIELSSSAGTFDMKKLTRRFEELCMLIVEHPDMLLLTLLPLLPAPPVIAARSSNSVNDVQDESPWSMNEMLVRNVVCDLLKIPIEGLNKETSFYRLGMDSILVLRLVKLLRERAGVRLSPLAVLRARCVAAVARLMRSGSQPGSVGIERHQHDEYQHLVQQLSGPFADIPGVENFFLATPLQQGMLNASLSDTINPPNGHLSPYAYRHTFEIVDRSGFDLGIFWKAWKTVVERVEILRTTFHFTGNQDQPWIGAVHRASEAPITMQISISVRDAASTLNNIDVSRRLVYCILVIPTASEKPIKAIFKMHHVTYDGASLPLLWKLFVDTYDSLYQAQAMSVATPLPYTHVAKQVAVRQVPAVRHWSEKLLGYSYKTLESTANNEKSKRHRSLAILPVGEYETLKLHCRELGISVQAALMLAWSKVIAIEILGQSDVVFGQVLSGQLLGIENGEEGEMRVRPVIGPTFNTVAVRIALSAALSNRQALERMQKLCEEAQEHQVASLRTVQNEWRSGTSAGSASSLFESLFLFNGDSTVSGEVGEPQSTFWKPSRLETDAEDEDSFAEYPLVCNITVSQDGLHVRVSAASDRLDSTVTDKVSAHFKSVLVEQMHSLETASIVSSLPAQRSHETEKSRQLSEEDNALCIIVLDRVQDLLQHKDHPMTTQTIDADTNLFRVGLDSILAIRLSSKLRKTAVPLTVNEIMQGNNVAAIVAKKRHHLSKKSQRSKELFRIVSVSGATAAMAVRKLGWNFEDVESTLPCLAGQEHHLEYWMFSGYRFFQAPWIYKLRSRIAVADLRRAWDELRIRHPILRSSFIVLQDEHDTKVMQVTQKPQLVDALNDGTFTVNQAVQSANTTLDAMVAQHLRETNDKPSNLLSPPVHLALVTTYQGESAVVMRLHHAMYDAWSIRMLLRDLDYLVSGRKILSAPTSLTKSIQDIANQRNSKEEEAFWSTALESADRTILSSSTMADSGQFGPLGPQHLVRMQSIVPASLVCSLESLSQSKANSSLSPAILLAFAQTLAGSLESPCSSPTFGFYHASRSLGSLDLTQVNLPTLTLTPLTVAVGARDDCNDANAMIEAISKTQTYLSQLTQLGQVSMHDILKWQKNGEQPLFNSYINLLYRNSRSQDMDATGSMTVLERLNPSVNTYFTESVPVDDVAPCLAGLRTSHIAPLRIFVDVVIDKHTDGISLGIRCDRGLYDMDYVHQFAKRFVDNLLEVERVLSGRKRK